jgi:hypothetical protein
MKHPFLLLNQGVIPFVKLSHNGLGANPPALAHIRINPGGIDLGSWAMYIPLMSRSSAMDNCNEGTINLTDVTVGTLSTVSICRGDVRANDAIGRALITVLNENGSDGITEDANTVNVRTNAIKPRTSLIRVQKT